ncbi:Multidrug resistance protein MdtK [Candidatus Methanobinarius endosymbioticus]|uniref:Multidrug resistance protein MdtK n=1 Tax=Candidatus Methanobinarius endosymbioticus TaxID=2006182 RepID=A0A366MFZ7_9EURY|nr:Multidrug resistance protein MdtK [Candidatus Methanobinarius endosymbioticus]
MVEDKINEDIDEKRNMKNNIDDENLEETEGVSTILGDPKKAIFKLSGPMIVAMLITSLYNLIDGVWVAGLGQNALAAIGFITPIFMVVMGFSNGIGAGATAVISRFIGEGRGDKVDNAAMHIMLLTVIFTIVIMLTLGLFLGPILGMLGAGSTVDLGLSYGNIVFAGSIFMVFTAAAYGILRAEGNVKKTTYAMTFGAILNMILDPIFIYTFGWGIEGAGIATVLSMVIVSFIILYWFRGDTYVNLSIKFFNFSKDIMKKILVVGLPVSAEFLIMAILAGSLNMILIAVSGADAVAVYSSGYRVVMIAIVPIISVSISVVAIVGATFGARKYENFSIIQNFSIKLGTLIAVITAVATFILAPYIALLFTYSPETAALSGLITDFLRVMVLFYIFVPIGSTAASIFQGVGRGVDSFVLTAIRELLLAVVFAYVLAIPLGMGQQGVWWGIVVGNIIGSIISLIWSKIYIRRIIKVKGEENEVFN